MNGQRRLEKKFADHAGHVYKLMHDMLVSRMRRLIHDMRACLDPDIDIMSTCC